MREKNIRIRQLIAALLSIALVIGMLPSSFVTAFAAPEQMGTLSAITSGGVVTEASAKTATVTYNTGMVTLDWYPASMDIGRPSDGWWVGIKMTAPLTMTTEEDFAGVYYQTGVGDGWSGNKSFWNAQDSDKANPDTERFLTLWGKVNEEILNTALLNGTTVDYKWQFDWDKDGIFEQVANLKIDPTKVELTKGERKVYPTVVGNGEVSAISDGLSVQGTNNANIVKVQYTTEQTLAWHAKDPSVGRYNDGWWTGIKITAPESMTTEAECINVKYQTKNGDTWSAEKSFWNAQDSDKLTADTVRYLTMWGLLNDSLLNEASTNQKNMTYSWRFDWNGDGVYEQVVLLEIDPAMVTLNDKDGKQVYPELGTVTTFTGGTVEGITGNIIVTADELTLNWSPKDVSIGRNEDGWWAGIKVTAPKGMTEAELKDVKYQRIRNGETDWSADKSFWNNKDSKEGDESHYIGMWMLLTPSKLMEAEGAGVNITNQYRFDWNRDGVYEQLITFTVVPSNNIILTKVEQTGFRFATEAPVDQWIGESYTNIASGGQGTGAVTYSIESGNDVADVNPTTGEVTFRKTGLVTVRATKAADDTYAEATATYSVTGMKLPQEEFKFATTGPVTITYMEGKSYSNPAAGGAGTGTVTYKIISGEDCATIDQNGLVSVQKAGTITVEATKAEDAYYKAKVITYSLTVEKAEQTPLTFTNVPKDISYRPTPYGDILDYTGGNGTGAVKYEVTEGKDVAIVNENGVVTTLKAGTFKVVLSKQGDGCYKDAEVSAVIKVNHADQTTFAFETPNPESVTYNENGNKFENPAIGGESTSTDVIYEIISGGEYASIDETTGELTILKAGTVVVRATKAGDDCYNAATAEYELLINRASQTFSLTDGASVSKYYGISEYKNEAVEDVVADAADGKGYGTGAVSYSIEGANEIGAEIDLVTGIISFIDSETKVGTITIKVTKAADDCYEAYSDTYDLTVSYLEKPETPYILSGENKNESGWYTGIVKISAPSGYQISYDNKLSTNDWSSYVEFDAEKINKATVYLKNAEGYMTDQIVTEDIKIDTQNPSDLAISYGEPLWQDIVEGITYGAYKAPLEVTLTAKDVNSGIDFLTYNIGGEDTKVPKAELTHKADGTVSYRFTIAPQFRNQIRMSATDVSGRKTELEDGKILIVDSEKPTIKVDYEYESESCKEYKGVVYTQKNTKVHFAITESNFDVAAKPIVTVNDVPVNIVWTNDEADGVWRASYLLSDNGDYVVKVTFIDRSENEMEVYQSKEIRIDGKKPEISVTYDVNEEDKYYSTNRNATVKIVEHNFRAQDVILQLTATDVTGASIDREGEIASEFANYLKNSDNWTQEDDTYTIILPEFTEDAHYAFTIDCEDIAENVADKYIASEFVIDHEAPTDLKIEYSDPITPWWEEVVRTLTFGYYNPSLGEQDERELTITLTADDIISGVDYFVLSYDKEEDASNVNADDYEITFNAGDLTYSADGKTATYVYTEGAQRRGSYSFKAVDRAGNESTECGDDNRINIVDTIAPTRKVTYSDARVLNAETLLDVESYQENDNVILYYQEEAVVTINIEEANFYKEDVTVSVTKDGQPHAVEVSWNDVSVDEHVGTFELSGDGDYKAVVEYKDRSNNVMDTYNSHEIRIDGTSPVISVEYESSVEPKNDKYYKADRKAIFQITEHNFRAQDVILELTATDVTGASIEREGEIASEFANYLKNSDNWTQEDDTYTIILPEFTEDAHYAFTIEFEDIAENVADKYIAPEFVIDHNAPTDLKIEYSNPITPWWEEVVSALTFGYYNPSLEEPDKRELTITLTADDIISGVDYFVLSYDKEEDASNVNADDYEIAFNSGDLTYSADGKTATYVYTEGAQRRGSYSFKAVDRAGNESTECGDDNRINIVDTIAPTRTVTYSDARVLNAETLLDVESYQENDNVILYYQEEAVVTINIEEANFYKEDVTVSVTKDGQPYAVEVIWADVSVDEHVGTFKLSGDGDYKAVVEYKDRSNNVMGTYNSHEIRIDGTPSEISVEYESDAEPKNDKYYKADRKATIQITEHNFRADDVVAIVTAKDVTGSDIADAADITRRFADYLKNRDNWTHDGDIHTAEIDFVEDAQYTFEIAYSDIIGNDAEDYETDPFVIDHEAPTELTVSYSDEIKFWEEIKEAITFGYYSYNPDVTVTIAADDITSGIDYFEWEYIREDGVSTTKNVEAEEGKIIEKSANAEKLNEISYSSDGKTATTSFRLTAEEAKQYRGYITFTATDRAGNTSETSSDDKRINIVDTITPTRVVSYSPAVQVVKISDLTTVTDYQYTGENTNVILYYDDTVTVTFEITEANFYEEDVVIKVDGIRKNLTDWTQKSNSDTWIGTIEISEEGDHVVTIEYLDRSNNVMNSYTSQRIVIDKTAPIVGVEYDNKNVINTVKDDEGHDRKYLDNVQRATITVQEHNFRADDIVLMVNAKNIVGEDVQVVDYMAQGNNRDEWMKLTPYDVGTWRRVDDTYQLVIEYPKDANYTFDIEYKDLANNSATDYEVDYFTVDTTAPTNLKASYSTSILEKIIQSVTFGYYNAQMTVTIQADDETSSIYHFMYSYLKSENVSGVNAELINQAIQNARITREGKTSTTLFKIPERVLQRNNQFNGTIKFTAYDRSENSSDRAENKRVIVDNISPTAQVSYNNPVQNANGITYYAGDINATILINEANFYAEDVVVSVTRDGNSVPVSINWTNNSVDEHTGTFTLHEDGDYLVTINYADRSSNKMETYTSNQLTIDTKTPTIQVLPIKMNSANKEDVFGFSITANDTNLDSSSFTPVLTAVLRGEDGAYTTREISLGSMQSVELGKTCTYAIDNLADDAVYSLKCTVKDMSGNTYSKIALSDGAEYEDVVFSVNREGSTYSVSESTSKLLEQYYVYSVEEDVIIEEVNVDPVEKYVVKLNGKVLTEGSDYTTTLTNNTNEWSKRTYRIYKELFKDEGEYSIVVESIDKTETTAYSDVKDLKVAFVVDQTAPVVTISGLENGGRYQVNEQTVTIIPTDDGGRLNYLKVIVLDKNGNPLKDKNGKDISVRFEMSGEELIQYLTEHDGKVIFTIPEGLENQVQIICNDCAMSTEGITNQYNETFARVTVSQSGLVIYYANKPLFYGSIAAILAVIGLGVGLVVYKRRKKR